MTPPKSGGPKKGTPTIPPHKTNSSRALAVDSSTRFTWHLLQTRVIEFSQLKSIKNQRKYLERAHTHKHGRGKQIFRFNYRFFFYFAHAHTLTNEQKMVVDSIDFSALFSLLEIVPEKNMRIVCVCLSVCIRFFPHCRIAVSLHPKSPEREGERESDPMEFPAVQQMKGVIIMMAFILYDASTKYESNQPENCVNVCKCCSR